MININKLIVRVLMGTKEHFQFKKIVECIKTILPASTSLELMPVKETKNAHLNLAKQLIDGSIDLVVYPLDKLPLTLLKGIELAAVTERIFPYNSFLSIKYSKIEKAYQGSLIGVKSQLLKYLIKKYYPALKVKEYKIHSLALIEKLASGELKSIVLPDYELLNFKFIKSSYLTKLYAEKEQTSFKFKNKRIKIASLAGEKFLPVPCQGVLGIEVSENNIENLVLASKVNHYDTFYAIRAERAFLYALGERKQTATGVLATIYQNQLILNAVLIDSKGNLTCEKIQGRKKACEEIGYQVAQKFKKF